MTSETEIGSYSLLDVSGLRLKASPGQFFLITPPGHDPFFPRAGFPFRLSSGFVELLLAPHQAREWTALGLSNWRGPNGRSLDLPARSSHVLLLAEDEPSAAHLVACIEPLLTRGCEVVFVCGRPPLSEHWLSAEVEYRAVDDPLVTASDLLMWTDTAFACGRDGFLGRMKIAVEKGRMRLEAGWAQILLYERMWPCGTGLCYLCLRKIRNRVVRDCKDGPVFDLSEWMPNV